MQPSIQQSKHSTHGTQSGQIAVIVLLLMVVLLTVGLSLASRVTQDVFLSQQQSESARVFNAAETGAEDALNQDYSVLTFPHTSGPVNLNGSTYNYTITEEREIERNLREGESATVAINNNPINTLQIQWGTTGQSNPCTSAAIIASVFFEELNGAKTDMQTKVRHYPIAPDGCTRGDEFEPSTGAPAPYTSEYTLSGLDDSVLFVRIKAVYNNTAIRVAGANLPQQYTVRSQASNDEGTEQRTVEVTRGLTSVPSFMDYSLYTRGKIEKSN